MELKFKKNKKYSHSDGLVVASLLRHFLQRDDLELRFERDGKRIEW